MKPVRIKYFGLIPMTRRGYLIALVIAGLVGLACLTIPGLMGKLPPLSSLWQQDPTLNRPGWQFWIFNNLYRIITICLLAQVIETILVLRRFARKEAEQRTQKQEESFGAPPAKPSEDITANKTDLPNSPGP